MRVLMRARAEKEMGGGASAKEEQPIEINQLDGVLEQEQEQEQ